MSIPPLSPILDGDPPGAVLLEPNRPRQFYRAGGFAPQWRQPPPAPHEPEEWLASVVTLHGRPDGLTRLPGGSTLASAVRDSPLSWLGPDHVDRFGDDVALLVKLLDAGERLPVHLHPTPAFAAEHLGSHHGKHEAWVVVGAERDATVWLGFNQDVTEEDLAGWTSRQDRARLLDALNRVPVEAGDCVFVPAGLPHAIGAGVCCVELQEPTDLSLNLEWEGFDLPSGAAGQLGLTAAEVRSCVRRSSVSAEELSELCRPGAGPGGSEPAGPLTSVLPRDADGWFRAERVRPAGSVDLPAGFAVVFVVSGSGWLETSDGQRLSVSAGSALLLPWCAGPVRVGGDLDAVCCRPPAPV